MSRQKQNIAQVLHNSSVKFPKDFFAIVLSTKMAAVTSSTIKELWRNEPLKCFNFTKHLNCASVPQKVLVIFITNVLPILKFTSEYVDRLLSSTSSFAFRGHFILSLFPSVSKRLC